MLSVVNIGQKLGEIGGYWQPQIVGAINDFHVKLVRVSGSFIWHHHDTGEVRNERTYIPVRIEN